MQLNNRLRTCLPASHRLMHSKDLCSLREQRSKAILVGSAHFAGQDRPAPTVDEAQSDHDMIKISGTGLALW